MGLFGPTERYILGRLPRRWIDHFMFKFIFVPAAVRLCSTKRCCLVAQCPLQCQGCLHPAHPCTPRPCTRFSGAHWLQRSRDLQRCYIGGGFAGQGSDHTHRSLQPCPLTGAIPRRRRHTRCRSCSTQTRRFAATPRPSRGRPSAWVLSA